ncbi:MAG: AI-2E family transporter [Butyrivibrio sp.]|nr:AI-2E family transporter [Butyrivibrio sp.]
MKMKPEKNQVTWAITIFCLCVALMLAYYVLFDGKTIVKTFSSIIDSLSGIVIGIVIAFVLIPLLEFIEEKLLTPIYNWRGYDVSRAASADKKKRKQIRYISVFLTMVIFLFVLYGLFRIIIPELVKSLREIIWNMPYYISKIDTESNKYLADNPDLQRFIDSQLDTYYENLSSYVTKQLIPMMPSVNTIMKFASQSFLSVFGVVLDLVVGFIVAIYVLLSKERFTTSGKKLAYAIFKEDFANELIGGFRFVNNTFEGFVGGKLVDSLIIGIICYIGCLVLNLKYPLLISVIVGVTNIIPFFGPYIGGFMGALLLVLIDPIQALIFLIFVIVLQQFDGNILGPLILGNSTGLSSFWVIFSIMLFGGLWGIVGWLIGVPIFAVIYALASRLTNKLLEKKGLSTNTKDYYDLAYIEDNEYKPLSDPNNTKFNLEKEPSTFNKIFKIKEKILAKKNKNNTAEKNKK